MSDPFDPPPPASGTTGDSWKDSVAEFIDSRIELIRIEARDAGQEAAKRGILVGIIIGGTILTWLLLLAGLIGLIASLQDTLSWYVLTLIAAFLHLLAAIAAILKLRQPGQTTFPLTRSELAKDREWLQRLKNNPRKSKR